MEKTHRKAETIMVSIGMVVLAGLCVNIGNVFALFLGMDSQAAINLVLIFSSLIGFVAIPRLLLHYLAFGLIRPKFKLIPAIVLSALILVISLLIFRSGEVGHAFIIATGEEFLFRVMILSVLLSCFDKRSAFIIGSLIFAILLHLNGAFLLNVVTKFPASLILYLLADRFGLQSSVACHWFYNICVGVFLS